MRTRQAPALLGQKILVTIDKWDITSRYPEGHFVRALGKVESKEAEQESLLLEFDVPYRPFGKAILDCLPREGEQWVVPPKRDPDPIWRDREDLRQLNICSIDPPGAYLYVLAGRHYNQLLGKVVKILTMPYMPVDCQMGILKQASVSVMHSSIQSNIIMQSRFRYCRCFSFCSPGQPDGRRSRCPRDDSISRRQTYRHAASPPGDKSLLSPAFCRAIGILCSLGRQNVTRCEEPLTCFYI